MEGNMKENGRIIKCMGEESSHGLMEESMMENTLKTKNKEEDLLNGITVDLNNSKYITGQMEESMREAG